jgi:flagellin
MTQQNLQHTENQVSTGLKISTAADNAAYWSIGTKMNSQVSALGAVSDALNESSSLLSTMTTALNSTITIMSSIVTNLEAAEQPGADQKSIQTAIKAQQQQLVNIGAAANFNGQNFLDTSAPGTVGLVASYDVATGVSTINIDTTKTQLFESASTAATQGILGSSGTNYTAASILSLDITASGVTNGDIQNMLADVQSALSAITTASSTLGATTTNVTNQQTFITALSDSLTTGVSSLVDADMNQASTRLSALQVQQQLGIQALSIANSNTQLILKLFQ